jgi:ribosome biogenesis GTPase
MGIKHFNDDNRKSMFMDLSELGWNTTYRENIDESAIQKLIIGRVSRQNGKQYKVITQENELNATLTNSYLKRIKDKSEIPVVGDWVGLNINPDIKAYYISMIFPRKNKLSRKVAGIKSEEQLIASNIDIIFIVMGVDADYNLRRLERYLSMVSEIKAQPVIVLNKIDKNKDFERYLKDIEKISRDIPIVAISAKDGSNISGVLKYILPGKTIVLVGSSGVGKSTLINCLLGYSHQAVGETSKGNDKGRHITSTRELIVLPNGGMIIDNPGIRELQLWSSGEGIVKSFEDIEELSTFCKYKDCRHEEEPDCAVKKAVDEGKMTIERLHNYQKLIRENEYLNLRRNTYERRKKDKQFGKLCRQVHNIRKYKGN